MDEKTQVTDKWYVEIGGEALEVSFDALVRLASSGELTRETRVRRGDLRWREAGRVPTLAQHFPKETITEAGSSPASADRVELPVLIPTSSRPPAVSGAVLVKGTIGVLVLSLFITYLWMYHRGKTDAAVAVKLPEVQQVQAGYEKEKKFLEDQLAANQKALAALDSVPRSQLRGADTSQCYINKYSKHGPPNPATGEGWTEPVVIGREFDERCAEKLRNAAEQRAKIEETLIKTRREDLQKEKAELTASLRDLDIDSKGEQALIITETQSTASQERFHSTFIPVLMVLAFIGVCCLSIAKIREYKAMHDEVVSRYS